MTIDEAKALLVELRDDWCGEHEDERQALDIALWLMEREAFVRAMVDCKLGAQWLGGELEAIQTWEKEHPRP